VKSIIRFAVSAVAFIAAGAASVPVLAQANIPSKVEIAWNRYYDYDEMSDILQRLAAAYPELLTLQSIGKSVQGRDMWLITLNNPKTGADTEKPAMWIDANIHGNEVQGTEVVLYSIWYLTKCYGKVGDITELVDRTAFYFLPSVNPDSRAHWFREPNTPNSQRGGQRPTDNDYDGQLDEDGPEDINGDGHIGSMYKFDPNGRFRRNEKDPRIIERITDREIKGELDPVGSEGIDNDGDGDINEDGPGGYDMNRNWPSGWQPNYIQFGAGEYPRCFPEVDCIVRFILDHPNIAAVQSYHNSGGMILRGPGSQHRENLFSRGDIAVYDRIGRAGEEMLPYYHYWIIWSDLYIVHGGTVNWTAEGLGIISFTNELWSDDQYLQGQPRPMDDQANMRWEDRMMFGQTFNEHTEFNHPLHGKVLIGGGNKYSGRVNPAFMLEETCHRNFAFTMFHAAHMPLLKFDWIGVKKLGDNLWEITIEVLNEKIIPTRTALAAAKEMGQPDRFELSGNGVSVVASGTVADRFDKTIEPVRYRKNRINVESGIGSEARSTFRFIVAGAEGASVTLRYTAEKARDIELNVELREQEIASKPTKTQ
jgi:hypothetical protein